MTEFNNTTMEDSVPFVTASKDGRPLENVATLTIAEYADADGGPLYVKLSYAPLSEDMLGQAAPQSFLAMHKVWEKIISPVVTTPDDDHVEGVMDAASTTTRQ